ncbi:hypothetical protein CKAN_00402400 [Cinnamomum micranthum f. kanehirae]|uniref:PGG domain-containing protein n=1 Tax=Cinnamomum micranthum f. kanehirae TaxID=337451 RepID=A0A443NAT2_9MAGN|nr:hypothetical protein CKAN_00402400 [Cinnamomum micranthum f. kanehirae]
MISPILVAAKNGVVEIVKEILNEYSLAIYDEDTDKKNVFMLAVEYRQLDIYNIFLRQEYSHQSIIFQKTDKDGNSAIHLAATTGPNQPWPIPGAALQMQWELKWYEHVRETMPHNIFTTHRNNQGMTSKDVFEEAHKTMLKEGVKWLTNTAQSCSVVAALVATVAYASATTVPGGVEKGIPLLRNTYAFSIFTISSLVALCLSVTSLTMFLSILTSRNEISDFHHNLPMKLIMGLSSLFISIAAMLVSFCAGHFFDLADHLQHTAFPIYAVTCLPVSIYAATQFPLYFDLIYSIIMPVPKRNN